MLRIAFITLSPLLGLPYERALSLCAVLSDQDKYVNQELRVNARVFQGEHGAYLLPSENCDKHPMSGVRLNLIDPTILPATAWRRGYSGPYIIEGRLYVSTRHLPLTKTDKPHLEFDATRILQEPKSK